MKNRALIFIICALILYPSGTVFSQYVGEYLQVVPPFKVNQNVVSLRVASTTSFVNGVLSAPWITSTTSNSIFYPFGNVGINTYVPSTALHVVGTSTLEGRVFGPSGSQTAPTYSFFQEPTMGFWRQTAGQFGLSCGNNTCALLSSAGLFLTNNQVNPAPVGTPRLDILAGNVVHVVIADSRIDNSAKFSRIGQRHYSNSEEPMALIRGDSSRTESVLRLGGGDSSMNTVTEVALYASVATTTLTGTKRLSIDSTRVKVETGDVYVADSSKGIILKSPDGTCARGTIDDTDVLTFASVTCP